MCVGGRPASACVCGDGHEGSVCGGRRGMCSCLRPYELCPNITRIHHRPEPNPYMPSNHLWHHMSWERDSPFIKHAELFSTARKFWTIINMQITCTLMRTSFSPIWQAYLIVWLFRIRVCQTQYMCKLIFIDCCWNGKHFPCNLAYIPGNTELWTMRAWLSCAISATAEKYKLITEQPKQQ